MASKTPYKAIANNIKRQMSTNNISRKELASSIGVPYTTVCGWLQAKAYPRVDKIQSMSELFGCSKNELVDDIGFKHSVGECIRFYRKKNSWSQEDLASLLGYKSYTTIQKWESGVSMPSYTVLQNLSDLFGIELSELTQASIGIGFTESRESLIDINVKIETIKRQVNDLQKLLFESFPEVFDGSDNWQQFASEIRDHHGTLCDRCGKPSDKLHVHHIRPIKYGYPKNCDDKWLAVLCPKCHRFVHSKQNTEREFIVLPEGETL